MIRLLQRILLSAYSVAKSTGVIDTRAGKAVMHAAYFSYKRWLEPSPSALRAYVPPGAWVVDVGANLGFYTRLFASWVSTGGKVIALEPEAGNFAGLQRLVDGQCPPGTVIPVRAVASEIDGSLRLRINPDSHADHRIADDGLDTPSHRLDSLLAMHGHPPVGLIKIDVQGAEPRVLAGSGEVLRRHRPAVYMEVDDAALSDAGSSAGALLDSMRQLGYAVHQVHRNNVSPALDAKDIAVQMRRLGYADFLFLPERDIQAPAMQISPTYTGTSA